MVPLNDLFSHHFCLYCSFSPSVFASISPSQEPFPLV